MAESQLKLSVAMDPSVMEVLESVLKAAESADKALRALQTTVREMNLEGVAPALKINVQDMNLHSHRSTLADIVEYHRKNP